MTLHRKLEVMGRAMAGAAGSAHHYWRPGLKAPFLVWAEDGESGSEYANDRKTCQALSGTTDYYTRIEYDPVCEKIQEALEQIGAYWELNSVQYEEDTGLIHYEWTWRLTHGKDEAERL